MNSSKLAALVEDCWILAQVVIVLPPSFTVYVLVPQRPVMPLAVSTESVGIANSALAVLPSVTVIELGEKEIFVIVAARQGFVIVSE